MFARGVIVLLCVLVAVTEGAKQPNCKNFTGNCPKTFKPLCGTNGVTYNNECLMCAAIKATGTQILIKKNGKC